MTHPFKAQEVQEDYCVCGSHERDHRHAGGRPSGPRMPCGWRCGAKLTASEMRRHFTDCPKRPK